MQLFKGVIIRGNGRGKQLGFPTANMAVPYGAPQGIFISQALVDGTWHNALTFIGAAQTFGDTQAACETYILDFDADVYGQELTVKLLQHLRDNETFASVEDLVRQIRLDEAAARDYFLQH